MSAINVNGRKIAYHQILGDKKRATVLFAAVICRAWDGTKALFFQEFCKNNDLSYIRFDYSGHGASSGDFIEGTIGAWLEDTMGIIKELVSGKLIIIGSSMGGWIGLLAAQVLKAQVKGFIGIAAAPDFTRALMWKSFPEAIKKQLIETGLYLEPSEYGDDPYKISYNFITESDHHLMLGGDIRVSCPVRLFHGMKDVTVPPNWTEKIAAALTSDDVLIHMVEGGDHRLSSDEDLKHYQTAILELI